MFSFIFQNLNNTIMSEIELFLKEFKAEAITTEKMLALVPFDKKEWAPHAKSMKLYSLASHVADIAIWVSYAIKLDSLDVSDSKFATPKFENNVELLAYFKKCFEQSVHDLVNADESTFGQTWLLKYGDQVLNSWTKSETIRHSISQIIHHRAQLGVYLRLLDIPIPGSYGPSADEMGM
jgi:uncharacterized damage-inducible protein DinB